jgi:hypothetical protein
MRGGGGNIPRGGGYFHSPRNLWGIGINKSKKIPDNLKKSNLSNINPAALDLN